MYKISLNNATVLDLKGADLKNKKIYKFLDNLLAERIVSQSFLFWDFNSRFGLKRKIQIENLQNFQIRIPFLVSLLYILHIANLIAIALWTVKE